MNNFDITSFLIVTLLSLNSVCSQTSIEPIIGFSLIKNTGLTNFDSNGWSCGAISDNKYYNKLNYGIGITHQLSETILLDLRGQFSQNRMTFIDTGFVGYTDLKFNRIGLTSIPSVIISKIYQVGFGLSYHRLNNFSIGKERLDFWSDFGESGNQNQIGWVAYFGVNIKSIVLGVRYFNLNSIMTEDQHQIDKTKFIELSLVYRIKILPARRKRLDLALVN